MTRLQLTSHAADEMIEYAISEVEIRRVVDQGVIVQQYPDDRPLPSRLMLGWVLAPVHVVCANATETTVIVITLYRPDPTKWDDTFTTRLSR